MQLPCVFGNLARRLPLGGDAGVEFLREVIVAFETHGFVKFLCRPLLPCRGFEWSASVGTAFKMFPVAPANIRLLRACRGFALLVVVSPHLFVGLFHDCLPIPECFGFVLCVHSGSSISNLNGQKKSGRNRRGARNLSKRVIKPRTRGGKKKHSLVSSDRTSHLRSTQGNFKNTLSSGYDLGLGEQQTVALKPIARGVRSSSDQIAPTYSLRLEPGSQSPAVQLAIKEYNRDKAVDSFSIFKFLPCFISIGRIYWTRMYHYKVVTRGSVPPNPCDDQLVSDFHKMNTFSLDGFSVRVPAYLHELALPNSLCVILPAARPALQWLIGLSQA